MAAKIGPAAPLLAAIVFWGGPKFSAKIGLAGPILGGTDFGVTEDPSTDILECYPLGLHDV